MIRNFFRWFLRPFSTNKKVVSAKQWIDSSVSEQDRNNRENMLRMLAGLPEIKNTAEEKRQEELINKYQGSSLEEIVVNDALDEGLKIRLLTSRHGYSIGEAEDLLKTSRKAQKKARLSLAKKKIEQKTFEVYGQIPSDDSRASISEDVKAVVWRRDGGKCIKCGSQEKLEFDHIIPHSKGGSDTARNLQLLCEKCNRSKGASV